MAAVTCANCDARCTAYISHVCEACRRAYQRARCAFALDLRHDGWTYVQIGRLLEVKAEQAHNLCDNALWILRRRRVTIRPDLRS